MGASRGTARPKNLAPQDGMHLWDTPDELVKSYRERHDVELGAFRVAAFRNPGPDHPVDAAEFLCHLDGARLVSLVCACYPAAKWRPDLQREGAARIRAWAWMALKGHDNLHSGYQALCADPETVRMLGFERGLPCYETMRYFAHERLTQLRLAGLERAILADMKARCPSLGDTQVEDCTPHEALRRDESAPYNGHYKVRMHRLDLRWDANHAALLGHQFYHGNAHESRWLNVMTTRTLRAGLAPKILVVDNGYAGFANHAFHGHRGIQLVHRAQESWTVNEGAARAEIEKRWTHHWRRPDWSRDPPWKDKLRVLIVHGTPSDQEAVGRWMRDSSLTQRNSEVEALRSQMRAQNEGLNAELKRLPLRPQRGGALWQLRRVLACTMTLFLVQWTRLIQGVTHNLCRTAYIV